MTLHGEAEARAWLRALPECDADAEVRLELLLTMLAEENRAQNLVAAASLETAWLRHIADSAQLLRLVPRETSAPWLDLGTGAGFPGLVISALRPGLPVHLVESRARRVEWLKRAAAALGLRNVTVHGMRLEQVESFPAGIISARAFAPLPRLLALSVRFSTTDTAWLLPKGRSAAHELAELRGWNHVFHVEQSLTDPHAGIIVGQLLGPGKPGNEGKKP